MDAVKQALSEVSRSVVLITAAVCGATTLLLWSCTSRRAVNKKIQRARERRDESLQRAEQAVRLYKESHPLMGSPDILTLSLPELTKQLRDGSLNPENVLYSYMEKTLEVHIRVNCCTWSFVGEF
ncbi:vitamin D3 hydroxylase-associated protein-like [Thalassophryne amazonica]|uniref:vitamin D3 hydroxylase-associated protein-like n=1 Tax=Thalassophryne amazonica TaxID=390379 RepID=UPI001471F2C4|nr:vitamin D3 hydroxylase-associated protein-like [Thalassophryne amazonica]